MSFGTNLITEKTVLYSDERKFTTSEVNNKKNSVLFCFDHDDHVDKSWKVNK